jgi:hypothetical protein
MSPKPQKKKIPALPLPLGYNDQEREGTENIKTSARDGPAPVNMLGAGLSPDYGAFAGPV